MNSAIFFLLNRVKGFPGARIRQSPEFRSPAGSKLHSTNTNRSPRRPSLNSAVYPLGLPNSDISMEIDSWVSAGNRIRLSELQTLIRDLRHCRRHKQALQVSEWAKDKWKNTRGGKSFMAGDHAVHLDLVGEVRGLPAAETYFESLKDKDKNEKTYGALLNCYVRKRVIDESISLMKKMKEMGMASSPLPYNNIMSLYGNTGQLEKVPSVLEEMKKDTILPDNFSYRICINSLGARSDIEGMEKVLEEMEAQRRIVVDWNTYAVVANIYAKAGLDEKAISMLRKSEQRLEKKKNDCYNHLISLYCVLGKKQEIWRLWKVMKENCKKYMNADYTTMLRALVKVDELEEAEELVKEWESSGNSFDFRVPNVLLVEYRRRGLMEKAEQMIDGFLEKGKTPPSNSWGIVAAGYVEKGELGKACEFMTNALCVYSPSDKWSPNPSVIGSVLQYLGEEGEVKMVESFVGLLKNAMVVNRDVYHTLIKCNLRAGRSIDEVLEEMKSEGMEPNEDTHGIIVSFKSLE